VQVNRHTPAVIFATQGAILIKDNINLAGKTGQGFIHTIINDFLGQVIRPGSIGIHPGPLANRIKTGKDFY
jgi:hypothetical protein